MDDSQLVEMTSVQSNFWLITPQSEVCGMN